MQVHADADAEEPVSLKNLKPWKPGVQGDSLHECGNGTLVHTRSNSFFRFQVFPHDVLDSHNLAIRQFIVTK